ncbi:MAG: RNA-binding protein [Anaerolineae bacterium]
MGNKLYVGNLDYQTTSNDLKDLFAGAGDVRSAQVIMDRETRESKGFAFIEMGTDAEALRAISLYNGRVVNERALQVREALPRSERPAGGAPGGSGRQGPRFREVKHKARGGRKARNW